jgi:hypothetical protein
MKTGDFNSALTSEVLNEQMYKTFGARVNFEKYDRAQLENYRNVLRTDIHQMENTSGFNELLANESYQKNKHLLELLNTRIKEMLGEAAKKKMVNEKAKSKKQQQAAGVALAAKRAGKKPAGKGAAAKMSKMSTKELEKFAGTKHKGLPVKKKKKKTLDETRGDKPLYNPQSQMSDIFGRGEAAMTGAVMDLNRTPVPKADVKPIGDVPSTDEPVSPNFKDKLRKELGPAGRHPGTRTGHTRTPTPTVGAKEPEKTNEAKKSKLKKPDYLDFDKDGDKTEPMKKALADKKKKKGFPPAKKATAVKKKSKTKVKESQLRNNFKIILEGIRYYIAEDEEGKAMDITAGADMVKDFTSWMQRLGQYQTKSTIELADSIRSNFGAQEAEQFKTTVTPAIQSSLEALTASREIITKAVSVLAGEEQPDAMMGQPGGEEEPSMEEPANDSMNVPPEEGGEEEAGGEEDQFAASDAASAGRELRESRRQHKLRKLHEANSIMRRLAG